MVKKTNLTKLYGLKVNKGGVQKKVNNSTCGGKSGFKRPRVKTKVNTLSAMMKGCGLQDKKTQVCQSNNKRQTLLQKILNNIKTQERKRKAYENARKMRNMNRTFSSLLKK